MRATLQLVPRSPIASHLFEASTNVLKLIPARSPDDAEPVLFGTDRWDLSSIETWPVYSQRSALLWDTIENPAWRVAAKEVAMLLLQPQIAIDFRLPLARRKPYPAWALPYQRLSYWRRWFSFLTNNGHSTLKSVTQTTCEGFLSTITPDCRAIAITALRDFADYRDALTCSGYQMGFRPWGGASASLASGQKGCGESKNKTPVIPDSVFSPLVAACLFIVEEIAPRARDLLLEHERLLAISSPRGGRPADFDARLHDYLNDLRSASVPLPRSVMRNDRSYSVNLAVVALNLGMKEPRALLRSDRWAKLMSAANELGLADNGIRIPGTAISHSVKHISLMLQLAKVACYIVVAAFSGLRHSELAAIERLAYRREIVHGGITRHRLKSKLLKGELPGGKPETWTVIEPVVQALKTIEQLVPDRNPLALRPFSDAYRGLVTWVNGEGASHDLTAIPTDWVLRPRQFRRTLAREIAWRPNGVIAGKIHLKHVSVATTEGYAGRRGESANSFLAEIEAERRIVRETETRNVIAAIERGEPVVGLGSKALVAAVAALPDATPGGAQARDRDDALISLIKSRADTLHLTPLVHCWFTDPSIARCLRGVKDKSKPLVGSCQPDKCPNATIHREQLPVWLGGLDSLQRTIKDRRIPPGERERVKAKIEEMRRVVEPLQECE